MPTYNMHSAHKSIKNNSTFNTSFKFSHIWSEFDSDYDSETQELALELPSTLLVPFAVLLASLLMVGVIGNASVITVLIRSRLKERSRTLMATASTTNAYIVNLSTADLLFLLFCAPFQGTVYILNHWPYGWVMCKAAHFCQFCTVYASVWILTMMSVDRYVAIGHPLKSVKWRHPTQAMRISAAVWTAAALFSLPWLILYEADEYETGDGDFRTACYDAWSDSTYHYRKWMILFVFLMGFLVPSLIIFCMAILVAKSIRLATHQPLLTVNGHPQSANTHQLTPANTGQFYHRMSVNLAGSDCRGNVIGIRLRRRRRVGWLVFALAFLCFFCWTPHNLSVVWLNFDTQAIQWIHSNHQIFFVVKVLAHMMTYVNSCINPVLYSLASGRLSYACGARTTRNGPSATVFNSSFRHDHRTQVHTHGVATWRGCPSSCVTSTAIQRSSVRQNQDNQQNVGLKMQAMKTTRPDCDRLSPTPVTIGNKPMDDGRKGWSASLGSQCNRSCSSSPKTVTARFLDSQRQISRCSSQTPRGHLKKLENIEDTGENISCSMPSLREEDTKKKGNITRKISLK